MVYESYFGFNCIYKKVFWVKEEAYILHCSI